MRSRLALTCLLATLLLAQRGQGAPQEDLLQKTQPLLPQIEQLRRSGQYRQAIPLAERVLRLREAALGPEHLETAAALQMLSVLYRLQGAYEQAEPLAVRALAIRERAFGADHPRVADVLDNLANLYLAKGAYAESEALFLRVLKIRQRSLGAEHPEVANDLNDLGALYARLGAYSKAESCHLRALKLREQALGPDDPYVAHSLDNLAAIYRVQGQYEKAEPLALRALKIRGQALGTAHPYVARSLNNLGHLYWAQGQYAKAEPLFLLALKRQEQALGNEHPAVADTLSYLATLYREQREYAKAESYYLRALRIREQCQGPGHPAVASALQGLAKLYAAQGRVEPARLALERAFGINEQTLRKQFSALSEPRLAAFLRTLRVTEDAIYELLLQHPAEPQLQRLALQMALLRKGRSVEELAALSHAVHRVQGADDRAQFERLRQLRSQFAALSLADSEQQSAPVDRDRLKQLEEEADALEEELARRSHYWRTRRQFPRPETVIEQVAAALPTDGALLELVLATPGSSGASVNTKEDRRRYVALVLLPGPQVRVADLGSAAVLDGAVAGLRQALANPARSYQREVAEMSRLLLAPLLPLLEGRRKLYLSLDGQPQLIPFAVLRDQHGMLAEGYQLTYLTSARDLLQKSDGPALRTDVVVFADPAFNEAPEQPPATTEPEPGPALSSAAQLSRGLLQSRYPPLPGTRLEAAQIQTLWPAAKVLLGRAASEAALLSLQAPGILHVATHGRYLADAEQSPPDARSLLLEATPPPPNPLLRSALVLAGAGWFAQRARAAPTSEPRFDGLATALEVAGLDLWGTQLVVLSACQSGQGELHTGQGVYGLRRALVVAGAETLVTSLWPINDQVTYELIGAYYRSLQDGQGRALALEQAMTAIRARFPHPYYWAPFIVIGSGAPLRGMSRRAACAEPR